MQLTHESIRLATLRSYDVLDTPAEEDFDRITAMSAHLLDAELSCITLVDEDRFFFKSTFGIDARNLPRRPGFCDTVIQKAEIHCIEDATLDPVVHDHKLVLEPPHVRSYVGSPLITSDGIAIGTLCAMYAKPRRFTQADKNLVRALSEFVMYQLDKRRLQAEAARREQDIQNAQKLESLGMLAGGIAHDFNNLLVGVVGNATLTARQLDDDNPAQELLAGVIHAANQASEMTDQLLAYAGQRPTGPKPVDLPNLLDNLSPLLRNSMSSNVTLKVECDNDLRHAIGDPTQLRQVILNLVSNASDAYGGRAGEVAIKLSHKSVETNKSDIRFASDLEPGDYVVLQVVDAGCGMDEQTLKSVFDPFFSTKVSGRGLGMSIVQRIVRSHGGAVQIESHPDRGCVVRVLLPAATGNTPAHRAEQLSRPARIVQGSGTILVVDDEELVLNMALTAIKSFGFDVVGALTGQDAIGSLNQMAHIDALVLDSTMPGMNGAAVLKAARSIHPHIPAVITSGHHIDEISDMYSGFDRLTFLHKPWTLEGLSQSIHCVTQGPAEDVEFATGATA